MLKSRVLFTLILLLFFFGNTFANHGAEAVGEALVALAAIVTAFTIGIFIIISTAIRNSSTKRAISIIYILITLAYLLFQRPIDFHNFSLEWLLFWSPIWLLDLIQIILLLRYWIQNRNNT